MILKNWLNNWNESIKEWSKEPHEFYNRDIFSTIYSGKDNQALVPNALLEPYFGNPFKNSCVILNLNPGQVIGELQDMHTGSFVKLGNAINDYQNFAEKFPYLDTFSDNLGGTWWQHRNQWINRLVEIKTGSSSNLNPFALEICYWHSKSWAKLNLNKKECKQYLQELMLIAEEANKHSELKVITSVGKLYCKIFELLGYEKIIEVNNKNFTEFGLTYPLNKELKPKDRTFSLFKSPTGTLVYNTWHTGGNKQPSDDWAEIEKFVITY
ncbi:hypothetical protein ACSX1A_11355 [Pontibacter sp. MBLB2868]|uniref:hypothetical protein n=1 Tax=Pontibacter sp. MBLB2868 TaxID=3451555 RepID=UPI003F751ECF